MPVKLHRCKLDWLKSGACWAIECENGTWYREESRDMAKTIRAGSLMEREHAGLQEA